MASAITPLRAGPMVLVSQRHSSATACAMPQEVERRFLVNATVHAVLETGERIIQGYLPSGEDCTLRVRIVGHRAFLTKKGRKNGCCRDEIEREIDVALGLRLLHDRRIGDVIEKTRYRVKHHGFCWEVDVFHGDNAGLIIAEIELDHPEDDFPLPAWVGTEVTNERSYSNSSLARCPVKVWRKVA